MQPSFQTSFSARFTQVGWVVKDLKTAERFFNQLGIVNFSKAEIIRLKDFGSTHYGKPSEAESLVTLAYTGETFIEIIQPLSGRSIFQDYLDANPAGGIHHIAYSVPIADLDKVISEMATKGLQIVTSVNHPIAKIVFFDTSIDMGVFTEIMGITEEGEKAVQQMKGGKR